MGQGHTRDDAYDDAYYEAFSNCRFSANGTRVMTGSRDRTITIWDVHLEQRTPDAIHKILGALDPWTLSSGILVPVAAKPLRGNR